MPSPADLSEFRFNKNADRYIAPNGRFVSNKAVIADLERMTSGARGEIYSLSTQLQAGEISLAEWQLGMRSQMKIIHNAQACIAKGGWAQMSQADWGAVGQMSKAQYAFLQNFAIQIESGQQPLNGTFLRRAQMYADAGRGTYWQMKRREAVGQGKAQERRIRFAGDSCKTCIVQAALGWQRIGVLKRIGDSECRTNCRCQFEFRNEQPTAS
jgi:hypothetical protein